MHTHVYIISLLIITSPTSEPTNQLTSEPRTEPTLARARLVYKSSRAEPARL
ncbi:hypothetical protein HanRHA438_Chr02g0086581 [Helianthus annuus]|nr:hypothetical protein HanRHA438_Chr02g0086581 [Helianthus annuus]